MPDSVCITENENDRIEALRSYRILDTHPEKEFNDLTKLAAEICQCPVSLLNFISDDRQWAKSIHGAGEKFREIPRKRSVCQYTIMQKGVLEITDLSKDSRFKDIPFAKKDNGLKYYLGAPLITKDGFNLGVLCVMDYESKELAEKQKHQLEILANEVVARLELKKKNYELEEANLHKVDILRMLSHDLRSPLNGIIGISNLLKDNLSDNSENSEMVEMIEGSAFQLNNMIGEIMSYALMNSNGFKLERKKVDLNELLAESMSLYKATASFKKIQLKSYIDVDEPVYIDEEKFGQIIGNLLSNAIKFSQRGEEVFLSLCLINDNERKMIELVVRDTGTGMDKKTADRLFKEKHETPQDGTEGERSTGIGLAIVIHFTELHKGSIQVQSKKGKGSTFTVLIPV